MDPTMLRLMYRLSAMVVGLMFTVLGLILGPEIPLGRAGRGLPLLGILTSVAAIVFVTSSLRARRHPGGRSPPPTPLALVRGGMHATRERAESSRARLSAARHRRRRAARVRQAELAALEASAVVDDLAPALIQSSAEALFRLVYLAWDARDPGRLATLLGPELLLEWQNALDANDAAGEHHRVEVVGDVQIDLVGLTQDAAAANTTIVLVEAELGVRVDSLYRTRHTPEGNSFHVRRLCQYWTLTQGDPMTVQAIEDRDAGDHHLSEPIIVETAR